MKIILIKGALCTFFVFSFWSLAISQNKYGKTVLVGRFGLIAEFADTARPTVRTTMNNNIWVDFMQGSSSICDSATGKLLFFTDGHKIFDTLGNIMSNGDHLTDSIFRDWSGGRLPQETIILPLGNRKFAVCLGNLSDSSAYNCWMVNTNCFPVVENYDELRYNIIDMNANAELGAVIVKNQFLLKNVFLNVAQMQACKHANGKDWWLLKPGQDTTHTMYRFLFTADSIYGPMTQTWNDEHTYQWNMWGQMNFSEDGTKYGSVLFFANKLVLGSFDRCTGLLSDKKVYNIPIPLYIHPSLWPHDSLSAGVAFSPNNRFVYVSKDENVYQLDLFQPDSNLAWYCVQHGVDTTPQGWGFLNGNLYNGPDGRIYIGHRTSSVFLGNSVIDHPNSLGAACGLCKVCLHGGPTDTFYFAGLTSHPNYNMAPTSNPNCWPVGVPVTPLIPVDGATIYPNPAKGDVTLECSEYGSGQFLLHDASGRLIISVMLNDQSANHSIHLPEYLSNGLYNYVYRLNGGSSFTGKLSICK